MLAGWQVARPVQYEARERCLIFVTRVTYICYVCTILWRVAVVKNGFQEFQTRLSAIFRRLQQACHGRRLYFFIHVSAVKL